MWLNPLKVRLEARFVLCPVLGLKKGIKSYNNEHLDCTGWKSELADPAFFGGGADS